MKWILWIYLFIGIVNALKIIYNKNICDRPAWVFREKNIFKRIFYFFFLSISWPLSKIKR